MFKWIFSYLLILDIQVKSIARPAAQYEGDSETYASDHKGTMFWTMWEESSNVNLISHIAMIYLICVSFPNRILPHLLSRKAPKENNKKGDGA